MCVRIGDPNFLPRSRRTHSTRKGNARERGWLVSVIEGWPQDGLGRVGLAIEKALCTLWDLRTCAYCVCVCDGRRILRKADSGVANTATGSTMDLFNCTGGGGGAALDVANKPLRELATAHRPSDNKFRKYKQPNELHRGYRWNSFPFFSGTANRLASGRPRRRNEGRGDRKGSPFLRQRPRLGCFHRDTIGPRNDLFRWPARSQCPCGGSTGIREHR